MAALDVRDLRKTYGDQTVVAGLSFAVEPGTCFGLLGPNGAGKTTLISILAGLQAAASGQITLNGRPLAAARSAEPRAIALVPQDYAFYPMLTTAENLRFFAGVQGLGGAAARTAIDVLNAEQQVYITKRDLAKARFDTLLAQLKLKASVGSLSEADLEQINPLFEAP